MAALTDALRNCCEIATPSVACSDGTDAQHLSAATMRVSQLDSALLDEELALLLRNKLLHACKHLHGVSSHARPEVAALIGALITVCSVSSGRGQTPGCALLGLRYQPHGSRVPPEVDGARAGLSVAQRAAFGVLMLCQLVWREAQVRPGVPRAALAVVPLRRVEDVVAAASAANLLLFLHNGRHRNVSERALGARLVHARGDMSRVVSLDFLNRQLVWHELSELLLFVLPLLNGVKLRRLANMVSRRADLAGGVDQTRCPVCTQQMLLHCRLSPCEHLCCYFCAAACCRADAEAACPVCSVRITALHRAA